MPEKKIDLRSDTTTRPTGRMRLMMAEAEVADEQKYEDPTTNQLQRECASLMGKEAAVFLPSGTMANQIACRLHCRPGDEIIADVRSHIINFEVAGYAALSGCATRAVHAERGIYTAAQCEALIRNPDDRHEPNTALLWIEQTSNGGGGSVWPMEKIRDIAALAKKHNLALHMDGARLMNAVVASGVSAAEQCEPFDTCWIDFSKGLGCPVGAVLAGSEKVIREAWRVKQQLGGSMRQSGILAAACLHALDHHVERLADDHANAQSLAAGLKNIPDVTVEPCETNLVFFDLAHTSLDANTFIAKCRERDVLVGDTRGGTRVRLVTHLDIDAEDVETALRVFTEVITG